MRRDKREYEKKGAEDVEGQKTMKQLWNYVKRKAGWVKRTISESIDD